MTLRLPISWPTTKVLVALGVLYLIMMGSTFSSLGVVLPYIKAALKMDFAQSGFGFTLLALCAGTSSLLPAAIIKIRSGRASILLGAAALFSAYAILALCQQPVAYYAGAAMLGIGFGLIGAAPALHILGAFEDDKRGIVFGTYLAFGGLGGAIWPSIVEAAIGSFGGWRAYWWFMAALIVVATAVCLPVIRERSASEATGGASESKNSWTLFEALRTSQFYVIGCAIAATYLIASTVNAFTVSYLTRIGIGTAIAVIAFSVQSACHSAFPLAMGGIAARVGVKALLIFGLMIQAIGMLALGIGGSLPVLAVFAIGVGGGYGTIFLATSLSLQEYFGHENYAQIFGANQLFTIISIIGPAIIGRIADLTGRFDISFYGCAGMLFIAALGAATLRPPQRRAAALASP
jgi:MFS transporter, OFA family, oxalate/formate antiporter